MSAVTEAPASTCPTTDHLWSLRDVEFGDVGEVGARRFECVVCAAVRFD